MEHSDHQSTESGALIGSNDDLLIEILIRVPVTSILRFKSVSKHWRLLLSHMHFTHRYDIRNLLKSPGLFAEEIYVPFDVGNPITPPVRSVDFYFDHSRVKILQSCNGLLLCCSDIANRGGRKYYVLNPTTKQFATIPSIPGGHDVCKNICFMGLAYHPTDCVHYKLVCIVSLDSAREMLQFQIYSSDTRKWKISIDSFYLHEACFRADGVYWNGAVFWASLYSSHLYFKIDVEQLQTLPLPKVLRYPDLFSMYFGESRGHLHLTRFNGLCLDVYEMFRDHSGWFVKYQVELGGLVGAFPDMISPSGNYYYIVIDVVRGKDEEDTFLVLNIPKKIITYNVHDKSFKQILTFEYSFIEDISSFQRYTETLSSF